MTNYKIDNGRSPDQIYYSHLDFISLPTLGAVSYTRAFWQVIIRLDEANRHITENVFLWNQVKKETEGEALPTNNYYQRLSISNEVIIYLLRRAADDLIMIIYVSSHYKANQSFPQKLKIDSLGKALLKADHGLLLIINKHREFLEFFNKLSNAFKHSCYTTQQNQFYTDDPYIYAYDTQKNEYGEEKGIILEIKLETLCEQYTLFYKDCKSWLEEFSENHRSQFLQ